MYPQRRALSAGISTDVAEMSFNKSAHSQTSKYILSPFDDVLLCNEILLNPALLGKYRYSVLAPVQYSQFRSKRSPSSPSKTLYTLIMYPVLGVCDFLRWPVSFWVRISGGRQMVATSLYRSSVCAAVYLEIRQQ